MKLSLETISQRLHAKHQKTIDKFPDSKELLELELGLFALVYQATRSETLRLSYDSEDALRRRLNQACRAYLASPDGDQYRRAFFAISALVLQSGCTQNAPQHNY